MKNKGLNILILENENNIDEVIIEFADHYSISEDDKIETIENLSTVERTVIADKIVWSDVVMFSSTFYNAVQAKEFFTLFINIEGEKDIYIRSVGDSLMNKLFKIIPDDYDGSTFPHRIISVEVEAKEDHKKSGNFFSKHVYFFDKVEYYWNDSVGAFCPERPTCFYNNNLKSVYKFKPKWERV